MSKYYDKLMRLAEREGVGLSRVTSGLSIQTGGENDKPFLPKYRIERYSDYSQTTKTEHFSSLRSVERYLRLYANATASATDAEGK